MYSECARRGCMLYISLSGILVRINIIGCRDTRIDSGT